MINFIPKAFTGEEDTCPVCIARIQLESALAVESKALGLLGTNLGCTEVSSEAALAQYSLFESFFEMSASYRVALAINLAIWFSAERYGRAKKVPDLLLAYDEYRNQSVSSVEGYKTRMKDSLVVFGKAALASADIAGLTTSHEALVLAFNTFFQEVDKWTDKRREEAFKVL